MSLEREALVPYVFLSVCSLGVIAAGGWVHYGKEPPLPPAPPIQAKPQAPGRPEEMRQSQKFFGALVQEDAKKFGVGTNLADLARPFRYSVELRTPQRMVGKDHIETAHLALTARVEKQWTNTGGGQGFGTDQFLLTIRNKTSHYLIYRVDTDVPDPRPCRSLGAMPHNAIGLRPHESVTRVECLWTRGFFLMVRSVESMEVPALAFYYASHLHPPQVLYRKRSSEGHQTPTGKLCELVPWRDIQAQAEAEETSWADVMDFYARHNCNEYSFFRGYKRRTRVDEPLPAVPSDAAPVSQK